MKEVHEWYPRKCKNVQGHKGDGWIKLKNIWNKIDDGCLNRNEWKSV